MVNRGTQVAAIPIGDICQDDADGDRCLACGSSTLRPIATRRGVVVVECADCGLAIGREATSSDDITGSVVVTDPNHFKLLREQYPSHLAGTASLLEARLPVYARLLGAAPRFWLEIGPGNGALADLLRTRDCLWTGVEFDAEMASHMLAEGKNVVHADFARIDPAALLETDHMANGGFDIVTFSQVFEHVREPRAFLANAFQALRPGGLLHVDVPNHRGLTARLRQFNPAAAGYGEIVAPHHLIAYAAPTLRASLERAGFEIVDLFSCAYNHPVFGLTHAHMSQSSKMHAVWTLSGMVGGGGNLVALARKPG